MQRDWITDRLPELHDEAGLYLRSAQVLVRTPECAAGWCAGYMLAFPDFDDSEAEPAKWHMVGPDGYTLDHVTGWMEGPTP